MPAFRPKMTPQQMAGLLDTAMLMPEPLPYLESAISLFTMLRRGEDAWAVTWLHHLVAEEEIEVLMSLRAAWRRGETRSPVGVID